MDLPCRPLLRPLAGLLLCTLATASLGAAANTVSIPGCAYQVRALNDGGRSLWAVGLYEGAVAVVDPASGETLWKAPTGGFPFDLHAADLDDDGRDELLAACADGVLYAFDAEGNSCWQFSANNAALYNVETIRETADGPVRVATGGISREIYLLDADGSLLDEAPFYGGVVRTLVAADHDGDGVDSLFASGFKGARSAWLHWRGGKLHPSKVMALKAPAIREGELAAITPFSLAAADLDGDGVDELVVGTNFNSRYRVYAFRADGSLQWMTPMLTHGGPGWTRLEPFLMTRVAVSGGDRPEVWAVTSGEVRRISAEGKVLDAARSVLGFTDVCVTPEGALLGSTPSGDDNLYFVDTGGAWKKDIEGLRRAGLPLEIEENLERLRAQAEAAEPRPVERDYRVKVQRYNERNIQEPGVMAWFRERYPYANITPVSFVGWHLWEKAYFDRFGRPDPDNAPPRNSYTKEQLLEMARTIEALKLPSYWTVDHTCIARFQVETLRELMRAAPTQLLGFISHEDESPEHGPPYVEYFLGPLAQACHEEGDHEVMMQEKNVFWVAAPANRRIYDNLFGVPERAARIVAGTDDANSRTPELNILGRMGLRQAGLIGHIQSSAIYDLFCYSRMWEWEYPKHGHPFLRLFTAHAVLGADRFFVRDNFYANNRFSDCTLEFADSFFHLLGKGILFTPEPDQMAGLCPLGFAVHPQPGLWVDNSYGGHNVTSWQPVPEMDHAVLPHGNVVWGNTPTPPTALQAVLLSKERQFGDHVPATPYGPIAFVPAHADLSKVVGVKDWWHTDGIHVWREPDGERLTGQAAADALRESFEEAAEQLPFRAFGDKVFIQTLRVSDHEYRVVLVDPGWLDPADRHVRLRSQLGQPVVLTDLLSGEAVALHDSEAELVVPAGSIRILDARVN